MVGNGFLSTAEVRDRFGLKMEEFGAWEVATQVMTRNWRMILSVPQGKTYGGEWIGR
jgi:hypothetical protein